MDEGLCNNKKLQYTKRKGVQSMGVEINMDATLDRLFAGFKKLSPLLVGIGVTTGLILFLPQNVLAKMALDKLPDEKKIFIGMTFIISVALIIVIVGFQVVENVLVRKKIRRWQSQKRESYIRLADWQKIILIKLLQAPRMTERFDPTAGVIRYLETNQFISKAEPFIMFSFGEAEPVAYTPEAWLMDLYMKEPYLFQ